MKQNLDFAGQELELKPKMHLEELQANDARCARNETLLWKNHTEQLAQWIHSDSTESHSKEIRWLAFGPRNVALAHRGFIINGQRFHTDAVKRKTQNSGVTYEAFNMCRSSARDTRQVIHSDSTESHSKEIRWLAFGPRNVALAHRGFIINGQRFHTDVVKRKTQNSRVTYEAFNMCRSSARDTRQVVDMLTYYGVIKEILLMDYHMFKVPLFRCNWANTGNGVKEEDGFTLVNLHMNQAAYLTDPFILPSQAKQVFYSREDDFSNWYVVMRAPPRGYHELETEEDLGCAHLPVQEVDDLDGEASEDDSVYVRDDCEGLLVVD